MEENRNGLACFVFFVKSSYVFLCYIILFVNGCVFQAWRERHRPLGANRSGYAELRDNRSSLVTETKPNGNKDI